MWFFILGIGIELVTLFILSRRLTQNLFISAFLLTKSRPIGVGFLSFLFFPGTVIHELAHLFTAEIFGVRTGGLTLVPEGIEEKDVRTGSVSITQTDPIRRAIIGIAPVFTGLMTLGVLSYFIPGLWEQVRLDMEHAIVFSNYSLYALLFALYSLFAVSNTMFSSPEDLEGFWPVVIVVTLLLGAAYIAGIRITFTDTTLLTITQFLQSATITLGYVTGFNFLLFALSKLLIRGTERLTKRRLSTH